MSNQSTAVCAILAGGEGRRLGGVNKATLNVGGRRMVDRLVDLVRPQCHDLALCLQTRTRWAADTGLKVLLDRPATGRGPLGGICAALHWAKEHPKQPHWVVTIPVDIPFLPTTLVERLTETDSDITVAQSGERDHHVVAAWRPHLAEALDLALTDGPVAVRSFQSMHAVSQVTWPVDTSDPFLNINTPEDIELAEHLLTETNLDHR